MDLSKLVRRVVEDFQSMGESQYEIDYDCADGPAWVSLDERLIHQVLGNLLSNAQKYTPTPQPIYLSLTAVQGEAVLCVQDRGIGIPAEDLPRLFEPFHRAANVGTIEGTGLGLPIVKQLVSLHGGHVEVSSQVGSGTTFCIYLPLSQENKDE